MAKPEIGYARTEDGLKIAYEFIEGADPVVLSLPTMGLQISVSGQFEAWREFRRALRRQNAWARLDFRGSGLSDPHDGELTVDDLTSDVEAVVRAIGGRSLLLTGCWSSCCIAVDYALKHPDDVVALLLDGPIHRTATPEFISRLEKDWFDAWVQGSKSAYAVDDSDWLQQIVKQHVAHLSKEQYWNYARATEDWDLESRLTGLGMPVLFQAAETEAAKTRHMLSLTACSEAMFEPGCNGRALGARYREALDGLIALNAPNELGSTQINGSALSERENQVIQILATGVNNSKIAEELFLSIRTVEHHLSSIYAKAGVRGRVEATAWAIRSGVV